tara:strand:+ start:45 stop:683 length:639 start_codon:yes stop_codon:yes gene_type:complete
MALTQFNQWEPRLDPVNGMMQQEPRVFGHDAKLIVIGAINNTDSNHGLNMTSGGNGGANPYVVGDTITLTTGTGAGAVAGDRAVVTVLAIDADGKVTDYEVTTVGAKYQVGDTANQVSTTSAAGTGFASTVTNIDIPNTQKRGCCLYIGDITAGAQMKVIMESAKHDGTAGTGYAATDTVTFEGVLAGGYNPILVKQLVYNATGPTSVLALY